MSTAFDAIVQGAFREGLDQLQEDSHWRDARADLEGPFFLGRPDGAAGWGEGVLFASLLKRVTAPDREPVTVFAPPPLASVLTGDPSFRVTRAEDFNTAQRAGARSPLRILEAGLQGLANAPLRPLVPSAGRRSASDNPRPRIGVCWASLHRDQPIASKSLPCADLLGLVPRGADVVSVQRNLSVPDLAQLLTWDRGVSFVSSTDLDSDDQSPVVRALSDLNVMITVSTTPAYIAAALGVPVVLLASRRNSASWIWPVQADHAVPLFPTVRVCLSPSSAGAWWHDCMAPARTAIAALL